MTSDPLTDAGLLAGDAIWYRQTCRGGYGFQRDVPGTYLGPRGSRGRVAVELQTKAGVTVRRMVHPKNVRVRHG